MKHLLTIITTLIILSACGPDINDINRVKKYCPRHIGDEVFIKPDSTKGVISGIRPVFNNQYLFGGDDTTYIFKYDVRTSKGNEQINEKLIYQ